MTPKTLLLPSGIVQCGAYVPARGAPVSTPKQGGPSYDGQLLARRMQRRPSGAPPGPGETPARPTSQAGRPTSTSARPAAPTTELESAIAGPTSSTGTLASRPTPFPALRRNDSRIAWAAAAISALVVVASAVSFAAGMRVSAQRPFDAATAHSDGPGVTNAMPPTSEMSVTPAPSAHGARTAPSAAHEHVFTPEELPVARPAQGSPAPR